MIILELQQSSLVRPPVTPREAISIELERCEETDDGDEGQNDGENVA